MIRLAVVGCGRRIADFITTHLKALEPDLRVVAVVDPDERGARARLEEPDRKEARFFGSLAEMIREVKPDAIAIGTRCNLHAPLAAEAAKYPLPLFLEKPVATSMEQALALERAFEGSRCPVVVSFPLRVSPLAVLAQRYIAEGRIGIPEHLLGINYVPYGTVYFDDLYRDFSITQGLFIQKATHDFDYLMWLAGSPIVRVAAMQTQGRIFGGEKPAGLVCSRCDEADRCPESPGNRARVMQTMKQPDHPCVFGTDIGSPEAGMNEDSSSALLEFASGAHGAYTQVFFSKRDAAARGATVSGYRGTVSFDWYRNELRYVRHDSPFSDTVRADAAMSHFGGDRELAYDFISVIHNKGVSRTPIQLGLQSIYACLAAKESAEKGAFVPVRQVGGPSEARS